MDPIVIPTPFGPVEVDPGELLKDITTSVRQEYARAEARKIVHGAGAVGDIPESVSIFDLLTESDEPLRYRVADLWPTEGRLILAAARKAGKTTLMGNVARSLADGGKLLGRHEVTPVQPGSTVGLLDFEMSRNMLRSWYRGLAIKNAQAVKLWPLRGRANAFDIRDAEVRANWVQRLKDHSVEVLLLDCLAPVFNALGIDDNRNSEVGPVLDAVDALLTEAGISDCLIAHHMGHAGERSRGASRLRDWPEVEWKLVRERDDHDNEVDNGSRFFSAYGRDVDVDESQVNFEEKDRSLILSGGNRGQAKRAKEDEYAWEAAQVVYEAVLKGEKLNTEKIINRIKGVSQRNKRSAAVNKAIDNGWIERDKAGTAYIHAVGPKYEAEKVQRAFTAKRLDDDAS